MIEPVRDRHVWNSVRTLYVGSGVLFLANVALGVLNVFTEGVIPRGQVLGHFHAASIGWVTLGTIATAFWVFTGDRAVSKRYATTVRLVTIVGLVAAAGYIATFYSAFNDLAPFWLLPVFGVPMALVIWASTAFVIATLRAQAVVTTVHLLLLGALVVASLGALMGVVWGLNYSTDISPYPEGENVDPVGAHAGPMDMYLALSFAGIVELLLRRRDDQRWSKPGMTQMLAGVIAAFLVAGGLFVGVLEVAPIAMLLFLVSFSFYFVRVGYRTFTVNPFGRGRAAGEFWGGLAFPAYIGLFVTLVMVYFIPGEPIPHWLEIAFVHVSFVGMATNLLFAAQSAYAAPDRGGGWLEPAALWILNVGMLVFIAGEYVADRKEGALVMGLGIVLALIAVWRLLARARPGHGAPPGGASADHPAV